ncbi:MAG: DUF302 domain-containing protein [Clostridia bacterium]|nr:DUF302 domain-containing protein [Clostridia bacterium]
MEFVYEIATERSLEDTFKALQVALKENGFGTLFSLNFKDKFKEHDLPYEKDFYVLEVCNPIYAHQILGISENIGYFLPCKVVLHKVNEITRIGMLKPTALIHMVSDNMEAFDLAKAVEERIILSIQSLDAY